MKLVSNIEDTCVWCGAQETVYHFVKSCPMVRLLYVACRDVATPVVAGTDVGRWVSDDPIIALTTPTGLCVWWGLHRLWTLRCQTAVQGMDTGTLSIMMSLGVTFSEARVWLSNTEQQEAAQTAESMWFCQHKQHMLGEDPAVNEAGARAVGRGVATVGQQEAQERRTKKRRQENDRQRKRDKQRTQRDTSAQVSQEPEQWASALTTAHHQPPIGVVPGRKR